ncbi:hypothetical protein BGX29_009569 [Mortierella sp. GBA35]|nr:hypothetical protein BGX29_009569 [Mortierella sp. GBA35]
MSELGMYFGIAIGSIVLLGVCSGILYHKYRQDKKVVENQHQEIQERLQQVADLNLPPFYVDHEQDPVCIYEHELPPDVLPPVQPIFVHSASDDSVLIHPEDDPLVANNVRAPPSELVQSSPTPTTITDQQPTMSTSPVIALGTETGNILETGSGEVVASMSMLTPPPAAVLNTSRPTTPSSTFSTSSSSHIPLPRAINQEMLSLARVRAPPSYDVPNVVVDRSPLYHPSTHSSYTVEDGHQVQEDYFGHVRIRAHTFSHASSSAPSQSFLQQIQNRHSHQRQHSWSNTSSAHQQEQQRQQEEQEQELPATPRYSLEFPSDVPHEHHLEEHQRSRAIYDNSALIGSPLSFQASPSFSTTSSSSSWDNEQQQYQGTRMQERSFSQPSSHSSSPLMFEQPMTITTSRMRRGLRARASTFGESSKVLMQRMHSLLRHSTSYSQASSPASSPRLSGSTSAASASAPMVGLGLVYGGHVAPEPVSQEQEPDEVVVIVDELENNDRVLTSGTTASSGTISLLSTNSLTLASSTLPSDNEQEDESEAEEAEEEEEDESVSKTQRQRAAQLAETAEPMATMPISLVVS